MTADEFFVVESGDCHFSETRNGKLSTLMDAKGPIKFGVGTIIGEFTVLLSIPPEFTVIAHTGARPNRSDGDKRTLQADPTMTCVEDRFGCAPLAGKRHQTASGANLLTFVESLSKNCISSHSSTIQGEPFYHISICRIHIQRTIII
eukprot:485319-Prorocentrum_minimum.AAC.4